MEKNERHVSFAKTAFIIMILSVLGRGLGLIRESILASHYGATYQTDAYKIAVFIPTMVLVTLSASIATTLIPVYSDYIRNKTKEEAGKYINNLLNIVALISLLLTLTGLAAAPLMVSVVAPGFNGATFDLTIKLLLITMPSVIFYALTNIPEGYLQANNIFAITVFTSVPYNIFIIVSVLFFNKIEIVAVGSLLAVASQFLVQLPFMKKAGYRYKWILDFREEGIRRTFKLMIPIMISSLFSQGYIFINRMLASGLVSGSISALDYADKANNILFNIVVSPIIMIAYPRLSKLRDQIRNFSRSISSTLKIIIYIVIPSAALLFILRVPVTAILYERGAFSRQDTLNTALALGCFSAGLPAICINAFLAKAFYSLKDTRTPMINTIFTVILNTVLSFLLVGKYGIGGLAISLSLSSTAGCVILMANFKNKIKDVSIRDIASALSKAVLASAAMALLVILAGSCLPDLMRGPGLMMNIGKVAVTSIAGIAIYFSLLYLMRVKLSNIFKGGV